MFYSTIWKNNGIIIDRVSNLIHTSISDLMNFPQNKGSAKEELTDALISSSNQYKQG